MLKETLVHHKYWKYLYAGNIMQIFATGHAHIEIQKSALIEICFYQALLGKQWGSVQGHYCAWSRWKNPDPDFQLSGDQGQKAHHYLQSKAATKIEQIGSGDGERWCLAKGWSGGNYWGTHENALKMNLGKEQTLFGLQLYALHDWAINYHSLTFTDSK